MAKRASEGLPFARLMMVLSGLTPLFILWGLRGIDPISDKWWIPICLAMVGVPNLVLAWRLSRAQKQMDKKTLTIGEADDNRDHLLVYLFAMVMPLFDLNVHAPREAVAMVTALLFIVFLFWHLNLHYMNFAFALFGYHVFTIQPPESSNEISGGDSFVLLTKRASIRSGKEISAYRISNTVYWEV
jgi:hypothetical protein